MNNSFPPLRHAAAFAGCFLTHRQAVYKWKLSREKKDNNSNKSKTIQIYRCQCSISGPIDPFRKSHSLCGVYFFPLNQSKNWINRFSQRWLYGYIPLTRSQNDPGARGWRRLWRDDARISKKTKWLKNVKESLTGKGWVSWKSRIHE